MTEIRRRTRVVGAFPDGKRCLNLAAARLRHFSACSEPLGAVTHWTGQAMAKKVGVSLRTVPRILEEHRRQPHRLRTFQKSNDPNFADKVEDIVGLYRNPPAHTVVLSIDDKSQIQALDRTSARPAHEARKLRDHDPRL